MSLKLYHVAISLVIAVLGTNSPTSAADKCVAGTVESLLGTTCTIGNIAFTFHSAHSDSRSNGVSQPTEADHVWFIPDPLRMNPGFVLLGDFMLTSTSGEDDNVLRFQLELGIEILHPPVVAVTGISAEVNGVNAFPSIGNNGYSFAQAENSNWPCSGPCAIATATEGYSFNSYIIDSSVRVDITPFRDACCGLVQLFASAQNGGSVSFDSVAFHFVEEHVHAQHPGRGPKLRPIPTKGASDALR
jgi:hypothetical protein